MIIYILKNTRDILQTPICSSCKITVIMVCIYIERGERDMNAYRQICIHVSYTHTHLHIHTFTHTYKQRQTR